MSWPESPSGELREILNELDRLSDDLRHRSASDGGPGSAEPPLGEDEPTPGGVGRGRGGRSRRLAVLDERLVIASAAMAALGRDIREFGERWERLQSAAERLEREIGNATLESGFLRSASALGNEATTTSPPPRYNPLAAEVGPGARPAPTHEPSSLAYSGFTVARYNSTIGNLKARHRRLAWWTVLIAAVISAILVTLAVLAHEPMPPVWLAILPVVWMIPVPFFVISFFSTQRVLRRNHLDLSGDP